MKKLLIILAVMCMAVAAQAEVLWDQSDIDPNWSSVLNGVAGCPPFGSTVHAAADVIIHDQVTITDITMWYTSWNFDTASATQAYLWIGLKSGSLPEATMLPQENGTLVSITGTAEAAVEFKATGLATSLAPGEYWVSLTPILPGGPFGSDSAIASLSPVGVPSALYEYCPMEGSPGWRPDANGFDQAILIEGTIDVVPTEDMNWGAVKAIYR